MNIKKILKEWVLPIGISIALLVILRSYVFFTSVIPSESMYPTLKVEDRLITSRIFSKENLKRGDIVVFRGGGGHNHNSIKRIIGLPGETIELKINGDVYVDGELLDEPYVKKQMNLEKNVCNHGELEEECEENHASHEFEEAHADHECDEIHEDHNEVNAENNENQYPVLQLGKYTVPDGKVLFFGDNRQESYDSRYWEDPFIDIDNIFGKAMFRIWPLNKLGAV